MIWVEDCIFFCLIEKINQLYIVFFFSTQTEFNYRLTNIRINCICPIGVRTKLMLDIKPEQLLLKEHNQLADEWKDITFQLLRYGDENYLISLQKVIT